MDIFETIFKRRSIRQFNPAKPVGDEIIQKILEAGIAAPSAGNGQCWRFIVVRDAGIKKKLALEAGHQSFIDQAPVVIVVCADLDAAEKNYGRRGRETYSLQDTAAAIENMLLAITAMGFASCWIGAFNEDVASKILSIPKNLRPVAMLPIGIAAEHGVRVPTRKKIEDITTYK